MAAQKEKDQGIWAAQVGALVMSVSIQREELSGAYAFVRWSRQELA